MGRGREVILVVVLLGELREPWKKTRFARDSHVCLWADACDESKKYWVWIFGSGAQMKV